MSPLLAEFVSRFIDSQACAHQDCWIIRRCSPCFRISRVSIATTADGQPQFPNAKVAQLRSGDAGPVIV
jgi:hypothetical protein